MISGNFLDALINISSDCIIYSCQTDGISMGNLAVGEGSAMNLVICPVVILHLQYDYTDQLHFPAKEAKTQYDYKVVPYQPVPHL